MYVLITKLKNRMTQMLYVPHRSVDSENDNPISDIKKILKKFKKNIPKI